MSARLTRRPSTERVSERADPRLLRGVQHLALAGVALVLVWPAARGSSAWLDWLPLWLIGTRAEAGRHRAGPLSGHGAAAGL
ncbi:hypothetical protein QMZ25_08505, partial [Stenotrophomonas sp. RS-48]|uniref:hypothetical protein n=1 Tax=Stenotrophomonas sp. RS-48 TaxID=3043300 RepID=UPI0024B530A4